LALSGTPPSRPPLKGMFKQNLEAFGKMAPNTLGG
jgi:hypothetical protein